MKERPILFSGPMVRAILEGRKTQTRRVMKPQPFKCAIMPNPIFPLNQRELADQSGLIWPNSKDEILARCPYGKIGDRLWLRETYAIVPRTAYACIDGVQQVLRPNDGHDAAVFRAGWERSQPARWRPSIHMPRWASRITLEITGIRVERLNEISEADALAEGIQKYKGPLRWVRYISAVTGEANFNSARDAFASLWESINGAGSWEQNPWVWVIKFRRLEK